METKVYNQSGQEVGTVKLSDKIFGLPLNLDLLQQARVAISANKRTSVAHSKDRSEVRGGGKKPWRQKGTGRSRHGSRRSPIWKGGGVAHGPRKEKNFSKKINVEMARKAVRIALSSKFSSGNIRILKDISISNFKTKDFLAALNNILGGEKSRSVLLILPKTDRNILNASRNIQSVKVEIVSNLNLLDVLKFKNIVFTEEALRALSANEAIAK
jgi:large subunit ribosomal protein L4